MGATLAEHGNVLIPCTPTVHCAQALPPEWLALADEMCRTQQAARHFMWVISRERWAQVQLEAESGFAAVHLSWQCISPPFGLTVRELDILTLLAHGASNSEIAEALHISRRTVDKHLDNIFAKTELHNRTALAHLALNQHLMRYPSPYKPVDTPTIAPAPLLRHKRTPITIGLPLPLQNIGHADAEEMRAGAALAIDEINQRGGVLGRSLQLETVTCDITDTQSVHNALSTLAARDVAAITAGYFCAGPQVLELTASYGAPFLHTATLDIMVQWVADDPGRFANIFQTCASDIHYARGLARFLADLAQSGAWQPHNRRIAIVQTPWPGLDIGLEHLDAAAGQGWEICPITIPDDDNPWPTTIRTIQQIDPAVILLACYLVEDSIAFQQAFMDNPIPALIYKIYSPSVPLYRQTLGANADGIVWATTTGLYSDPIAQKFIQRFEQRYGRRPGRSQAGLAYDRIHMLANAWRSEGAVERFAQVNEHLRSRVHRGVNGAYWLENPGQVGLAFPDDTIDPSISQAHLVFQIQQGRQRIIAPTPYAESAFCLPPWFNGKNKT